MMIVPEKTCNDVKWEFYCFVFKLGSLTGFYYVFCEHCSEEFTLVQKIVLMPLPNFAYTGKVIPADIKV